MSNIFHEIKHGFLILGFTGPLSSGCTSAANFFVKNINQYINMRVKKLPAIQSQIEKLLLNIKQQKIDLNKERKDRHGKVAIINKCYYQLSQQLELRETLTVLSEYNNNEFFYISMTDMLIKLTIESLSDEDEKELSDKIKRFKLCIDFDPVKIKKAKKISDQIKNRQIASISPADMDMYEEFLKYLREYKIRLKEKFSESELGALLQDLGDNARRCGNPIDYTSRFEQQNANTLFILAFEANNLIKYFRNKKRIEFGRKVYDKFAIEAFRNPYEVEFFRNRYYEFFLFSIYAPESLRQNRGNFDKERDNRDKGKGVKVRELYKQNVSECVLLSDIAVNNDSKIFTFQRKLAKHFALICRPGCIVPTEDELFMQEAYSMSLKSNCISRQVGAVIVGQRGCIVGAGWNDVGAGQIPCGYRRIGDIDSNYTFPIAVRGEEEEFLCFLNKAFENHKDHYYCYKDEYSRFQIKKRLERLFESDNKGLADWIKKHGVGLNEKQELADILSKNFSIKKLEYCRALHAEENAILQNAIIGGMGIEGATIYTTTFPCELCAKKIYQARIKRVVFTEPYPESISEDVFFKDGSHLIELVQFEGIKSYSYFKLYKSTVNRKEFQNQAKI